MKFRIVDNAWWMFWARGMVIGRWVFFEKFGLYDDELYRHELQHCYQMERLGRLKWHFAYFGGLLLHLYWNHPMEIEAREKASKKLTERERRWRNEKKVVL